MLARILSGALIGIDAYPVEVEVDIAQGLPQFSTVGLPEGAVKESKDRVKSAIKNSGYDFPPRRITINLAPADIRKEGAAFDLPMAVADLVLAAALWIGGSRRHRDGLSHWAASLVVRAMAFGLFGWQAVPGVNT